MVTTPRLSIEDAASHLADPDVVVALRATEAEVARGELANLEDLTAAVAARRARA